jgi:TorA maturation chaperone TorD
MSQDLAPWFAFAASALLNTDAGQLSALLEHLRAEASDPASADWIERLAATLPPDPQALEKEYIRLFLNPAGSPCSLWQSAYEETPQLMGAAHESALEWYRAFGVQPARTNEPADHAGLLLMFFARLLESGAGADQVRRFQQEHLAWIQRLADCVERQTRLPFYRELMALLRWLLETPAA